MQTNFQAWVNSTNNLLQQISNANSDTERVTSAIALSNHVLSLITTEAIGDPDDIIGENVLELPNAERFDTWFQAHPDFVGPKAVFNLLDGSEPALQAKLYWLKKRSNALMAGAVHFTPNWEDAEWSRNSNYKVGIDFFLSPDSRSFHIALSNYGKLRVLELTSRLTNTDIEVLSKWSSIPTENSLSSLHETLWDSFKLQSVNAKFYRGVAEAFTELFDSLVDSGRTANEAKMFSSRLLGRLIFIWFIRKMGLISEKFNYFSVSDGEQGDYYHSKLELLFFATLNEPVQDRENSGTYALDLETPYLNGGLFSPREDDWIGQIIAFPEGYFTRLYDHFNDFNFTTDESTPEYEQVAIDPEMLGRVFESLLASQTLETGEQARKAKGAFYTPREIVAQICKESVRTYLFDSGNSNPNFVKAVELVLDKSDQDWVNDGSNSLRDITPTLRAELLEKIRSIKSLDPACGSGAFPLGLLQLLGKIQMRLEPTLDPYKVKLSILQENIFGSDIEPMAVEITRLRSWLSLIIEERNVKSVAPLPNLEFNFVCANSLVKLVEADLFTNHKIESDLEVLRRKYFGESDPKGKALIRAKYLKLTEPDLIDERSNQLRTFNPFDSEQVAQFFDPEIMFGISTGFNIVVGNPPYVDSEMMTRNLPEMRDYLRNNYETARGNWDLYIPFCERAVKLLSTGGVASFIIKNSLMGAPYARDIREFLASYNLLELREFSGVRVFESAAVDTCIFRVAKSKTKSEFTTLIQMKNNEEVAHVDEIPLETLAMSENWIPFFLEPSKAKVVKSINSHPSLAVYGVKANSAAIVSEAYKISDFVFDQLEDEPGTVKLINTGTIDPHVTFWGEKETKYLGSKYKYPRARISDLFAMNPLRATQASSPKVIVIGMGNVEAFVDNDGQYLAGKTTSIVYFDNQSKPPFGLNVLGAVLNSRVARFWYKANFLSAGMAGLSPANLIALPMPMFSDENLEILATLAHNASVSPSQDLLDEIDRIVCSAYGIEFSDLPA